MRNQTFDKQIPTVRYFFLQQGMEGDMGPTGRVGNVGMAGKTGAKGETGNHGEAGLEVNIVVIIHHL